jgi:hypothetical protein
LATIRHEKELPAALSKMVGGSALWKGKLTSHILFTSVSVDRILEEKVVLFG